MENLYQLLVNELTIHLEFLMYENELSIWKNWKEMLGENQDVLDLKIIRHVEMPKIKEHHRKNKQLYESQYPYSKAQDFEDFYLKQFCSFADNFMSEMSYDLGTKDGYRFIQKSVDYDCIISLCYETQYDLDYFNQY